MTPRSTYATRRQIIDSLKTPPNNGETMTQSDEAPAPESLPT